MIKFSDFSSYDLGIIWGLGSYTDSRIVFRHKEKYFIDRMGLYFQSDDYEQMTAKGVKQYVLKSSHLDIYSFEACGWTPRTANDRDVPVLNDYKDFLRAYIELHGCFKYTLRYKHKPKRDPYKALAFIIYGNYIMLSSINHILADITGVNIKSVQTLHNGKTASLNYTSLPEIDTILNTLYDEPCHGKFWNSAYDKLQNPIY